MLLSRQYIFISLCVFFSLTGWGDKPAALKPSGEGNGAPLIKPGVTLKIEVLASGDSEVPACNKRVSNEGTISLPLIGDISAVDQTIPQLQEKITKLYRKYLRKPQVMLAFELTNDADGISPYGHVTILGRVKNPGWIKMPPTRKLTVARAIQQAGGLASSAKASSIKITRKGKDGQTTQLEVNLKALGSKGNLKEDLNLLSGDIVFVPEQVW